MQLEIVTILSLSCCLAVGMMTGLLAYMKLWLARNPVSAPQNFERQLFLLNLAIVLMMVLAGVLADTLGVRPLLIGGSVVLALALFALGAAGNSVQAPSAVLFAALGTCAVYVCSLLLMPRGLFGDHELTVSLTFGLVFIALGALVIAPLFDTLSALLGYRLALTLLGIVALAPLFLATVAEDRHFLTGAERPDLLRLVADPTVWLAGLVFFLYAPLEGFISVWASGYCASHREEPGTDATWLALFWISFSASRILFGLLLHVFGAWADSYQSVCLILPAICAAVCLGNMIGSARHTQALTGLIILGFCMGPILPTLLGIVGKMRACSESGPATAFGVLFGCGALGSLVLSPVAGWSAKPENARTALRIPLFIALAMGAASLFFALLVQAIQGSGPRN
jgi:MFS family permease